MSTGWLDRASRTTSVTPTHLIRTWSIVDPRRKTLDGVAITISGLDRSITDVLVRIVPIQGNARTQFMTSQTPRLVLSTEGAPRTLTAPTSLPAGFIHKMEGFNILSVCLIEQLQ